MDIRELDAGLCENIKDFGERAIRFCNEHNCDVKSQFNGQKLVITSDMNAEDVVKAYHDARHKAYEEYLKSEQYQIDLKAEQDRVNIINAKALDLLNEFKQLDLKCSSTEDKVKLLKWLIEYQDCSDNITCKTNDDKLVCDMLEQNGFVSDYICENADDAEGVFRWIVGKAIASMRLIAMHQMVIYHAEKWIEEHGGN